MRNDTNVGNETLAFETWHETRRCIALRVLGRLLRDPIQYCSPQLRHDAGGGFERARRAPRLLFRTGGFGNLSRLWIARHSRLLPRRLRYRAAISKRPADRLEEGFAPAPPLAVLRRASRRGPHGSPLHSRSFPGLRRLLGGCRAPQLARPRPARRRTRLHPLLGGRASQPAFDRKLRA